MSIANTVYFDPTVYRVILYDQRGAGQSTPTCELRENTSSHLVADIEVLRRHLKIDTWHMVFGGSWGSTLALLYAEAFPDRVKSLVLRGIFLCRNYEKEWGYPLPETGSTLIFPDAAKEIMSHYTEEEQKNWEQVTYQRLISEDRQTRVNTAKALVTWDIKRSTMVPEVETLKKVADEKWVLHHATLEFIYIMNGCYIRENQILDEINRIQHIPCTIVHGRYDIITPLQSAWDLHKALPQSKLVVVAESGHFATDPGISKELIKACDEFAKL